MSNKSASLTEGFDLKRVELYEYQSGNNGMCPPWQQPTSKRPNIRAIRLAWRSDMSNLRWWMGPSSLNCLSTLRNDLAVITNPSFKTISNSPNSLILLQMLSITIMHNFFTTICLVKRVMCSQSVCMYKIFKNKVTKEFKAAFKAV